MNFLTKFFFFCLLGINYQCGHSHDGFVGVSKNIKESKRREVYISSYKITSSESTEEINFYPTGDIWLEKLWRHKETNSNKTSLENTKNHTQLQINFINESQLEDYGKHWFLGNNPDLYFRKSSSTSLMINFKVMPPDTIKIPIQKGREFQLRKISNIRRINTCQKLDTPVQRSLQNHRRQV